MSEVVPVRSDRCGLDEMFLACVPGEAERARLDLGAGWTRRWSAAWRVSGGDVVTAVRDLGPVPVAGCEPVRRFSWGRRQRHRPGLQFMVSTGRVHGFESLEEQSLLLALDFTGATEDVLPQPFTLRFGVPGGGSREHVPDFLAVFRDGSRWLFDVRPARLVKDDDATCFAAEHAGEQRGGKLGSQLEQRRGACLAGLDAEVFQAVPQVAGADRASGLPAGEQPGRGAADAGGGVPVLALQQLPGQAGDRFRQRDRCRAEADLHRVAADGDLACCQACDPGDGLGVEQAGEPVPGVDRVVVQQPAGGVPAVLVIRDGPRFMLPTKVIVAAGSGNSRTTGGSSRWHLPAHPQITHSTNARPRANHALPRPMDYESGRSVCNSCRRSSKFGPGALVEK